MSLLEYAATTWPGRQGLECRLAAFRELFETSADLFPPLVATAPATDFFGHVLELQFSSQLLDVQCQSFCHGRQLWMRLDLQPGAGLSVVRMGIGYDNPEAVWSGRLSDESRDEVLLLDAELRRGQASEGLAPTDEIGRLTLETSLKTIDQTPLSAQASELLACIWQQYAEFTAGLGAKPDQRQQRQFDAWCRATLGKRTPSDRINLARVLEHSRVASLMPVRDTVVAKARELRLID